METGWGKVPSMHTPRNAFPTVTIGDRLFVFGGDNECWLSSVEVYSSQNRRWTVLPPILTGRRQCAAAAVGNKVLVCGGLGGLPGQFGRTLASAEMYDTETGVSTALPPMSCERFGCSAVAVNDRVYVFGGLNEMNQLIRTGEVFDMQSQRWSPLPPMNITSYRRMAWSMAAVVVGENIVVLGESLAGVFDTNAGTWATLPDYMRCNVRESSAVAVGDKVFTVDEDGAARVLDVKTQMFAPLPPIQAKRLGCSLAAIGNEIFVLGGFDDDPLPPGGGFQAIGEVFLIPEVWRDTPGSDDLDSGVCLYCKRPGVTSFCASCDDKYFYCNRDCQKADWRSHKHVCKKKKQQFSRN